MNILFVFLCFFLLCYAVGMTILANYAWNFNKKKYRLLEQENDLMSYWLQKKLDGIDIEDYLKSKGIKKVAFYKFTPICEMLCAELNKYVEILYCVDENSDNIWDGIENIPIIKPNEVNMQPTVELIIISSVKENKSLYETAEKFIDDIMIMWAFDIIKEF